MFLSILFFLRPPGTIVAKELNDMGKIVLYLAIFDPFACVPHPAFRYCTATVAVCVFCVVAYYILGKLLLVKRGIGGFPGAEDKKAADPSDVNRS